MPEEGSSGDTVARPCRGQNIPVINEGTDEDDIHSAHRGDAAEVSGGEQSTRREDGDAVAEALRDTPSGLQWAGRLLLHCQSGLLGARDALGALGAEATLGRRAQDEVRRIAALIGQTLVALNSGRIPPDALSTELPGGEPSPPWLFFASCLSACPLSRFLLGSAFDTSFPPLL